jgi:DnaJ-class molecular chaperone
MASRLLDQYQAAATVGMSPELLRYFVEHTVKMGDGRKLPVAKTVGEVVYFNEDELTAYDAWLRAPWPSKDKRRPHLPSAIREEVRLEANLECALCKSSKDACEAAHITPVAKCKSNHPGNLIWLCANHHTKFDNGSFGPKGADNKIIVALKTTAHHFRRQTWSGQAEINRHLHSTLSLCKNLKQLLSGAKTPVEVEAVESMGKQVLELLPKLASQSKAAAVQPTLKKLEAQLAAASAKKGASTKKRLEAAAFFEEEFLANSGLVLCPLCKGAKAHNGYDCPVCQGDGAVSKELDVDLREFDMVDCQLCGGAGRHNGDTCPVCSGDKRLERRFADRVDFSLYAVVRCPLCKGKRRWQGDDCPACHGDGEMPRGAADQVELDEFAEVDCPLCEGTGRYEGDDCPECAGNRQMQRRYADRVELSKYERQRCPLCKGKGLYRGDDCPACGGECELSAGAVERLDLSQFELVDCPRCKGRGVMDGDECRTCGGDRRMQRRFADRLE